MKKLSYETARRLKDAGFPQEVQYGDVFFSADRHTRYQISNSDEYDGTTGGYNPALGRENTTAKSQYVKVPTLSELIDAVESDYFELVKVSEKKLWLCKGGVHYTIVIGPTPEEAVAALWLALKKTPATGTGDEVRGARKDCSITRRLM